jgi:hypothetical protein
VLDTGADASAPGVSRKIVGTYDVRSGRREAPDASGHGTFVASLAAGAGGISGSGGDARLLVVKVADDTTFNGVDVAAGIIYAARHGARIINLSVAGTSRSPVEQSAIEYAALLQPVGSNGAGGLGLAVGASDFTGTALRGAGGSSFKRAGFSEFGSFISLAAPRDSVFGAVSARSSLTTFPRSSLPRVSAGLYGLARHVIRRTTGRGRRGTGLGSGAAAVCAPGRRGPEANGLRKRVVDAGARVRRPERLRRGRRGRSHRPRARLRSA